MSARARTASRRRQRPAAWLQPVWGALAHRLAGAGGSAATVIALLADVPLLGAVGRGALVWISVLALFAVGARALGSRPRGQVSDSADMPVSATRPPLAVPAAAPRSRS